MIKIAIVLLIMSTLMSTSCKMNTEDDLNILEMNDIVEQAEIESQVNYYNDEFSEEVYPDGEYNITYSATLSNFTDTKIDEVYIRRGNTSKKLAENLDINESVYVEWSYNEVYPANNADYSEWDSPYFVVVTNSKEVLITKAKIASNELSEIREELYLTSDWSEDKLNINNSKIIFFEENDEYYLSTQVDYLDKIMYSNNEFIDAEYIYFHEVRRWIRKREGQHLYAIGLSKQEIIEYFPKYEGENLEGVHAILLSDDKVYLHDVYIDVSEDGETAIETLKSNDISEFNITDSLLLEVDHARNFEVYFRYEDINGNIKRQYVSDEFRDNNNNGIINVVLDIEDEAYDIIYLE